MPGAARDSLTIRTCGKVQILPSHPYRHLEDVFLGESGHSTPRSGIKGGSTHLGALVRLTRRETRQPTLTMETRPAILQGKPSHLHGYIKGRASRQVGGPLLR